MRDPITAAMLREYAADPDVSSYGRGALAAAADRIEQLEAEVVEAIQAERERYEQNVNERVAEAVRADRHPTDPWWLKGADPHMDGSYTMSVAKYPDKPGTVTATVPAGYVLVNVMDEWATS